MRLLRKIVVSLIGFPILILGIILVPLPGPGLLVMLLGLYLISREFKWAQKYFEQIRDKLEAMRAKIIDTTDK